MSSARFGLMILASTLIMFVLMYLYTQACDHVTWSRTGGWMALLMGAVMAMVMLAFMWGMYENMAANVAILAGSLLVAAGSLWFVRSQATVDDVSWTKAMIPHHSIAVPASARPYPRPARALADGIIETRLEEIAEMKRLIADLEANPLPEDAPDPPSHRDQVLPSADALPVASSASP